MPNSNARLSRNKRIGHSSSLLMVIVIVLFAMRPGHFGSWAQSTQEDDFYYSAGKKIPVTVSLEQLGIMTKDGVSTQQITSLAGPLRMRIIRETPRRLYILRPEQARTRADMVKLAQDVRTRGKDLLLDAGLVVTAKGTDTSMIVTDQFIARFKPEVTQTQIDEFNLFNGVQIVRSNPFIKNQFLLRVVDAERGDALRMGNRYEENDLVIFAHANFWSVDEPTEIIPNDPLFNDQWHHLNTGSSGGTVDADAGTTKAWDLTTGAPDVVIAVFDDGFDIDHEDLAPNLFINPGEASGNNIDDDGNGFIDDVNGWDFVPCLNNNPGCGDNDPRPGPSDNHGTAVTGLAVARGNNSLGISGSCSQCRFLPLRRSFGPFTDELKALAINYASAMGAKIISNSWGQTTLATAPMVMVDAINMASAAGSIVLFAGGNENTENFCIASYPSLINVFSVSSATNLDAKAGGCAIGNCIDLLAPSFHNDPGTLGITTTDRTGASGFTLNNYNNFFGGTSSVAPLTAGIAGLVLSASPGLTRVELQRLLQDTADKIEPETAVYADTTGFSTPASGTATHSWGRVNAFEAVRTVAPPAGRDKDIGGKGGVDIFMRDNGPDWGNTERPSSTRFGPGGGALGWWVSRDIKVDAPPYAPAPTTSAAFDAFTPENAISGVVNKVYVRVRNRGPAPANSVNVKLYWAFAGTALPSLPANFWSVFPADSANTSQWRPLGVNNISNLAYSGSSVAGCPGRLSPSCDFDLNGDGDTTDPGETASDEAQVSTFDFFGPPIGPLQHNPDHFSFLAIIDSAQDPIDPQSKTTLIVDDITPKDNNITLHSIKVEDTKESGEFRERFYIRNPYHVPILSDLRLNAPSEWIVKLEQLGFNTPFILRPRQQILVTMNVSIPQSNQVGEVTVTQRRLGNTVKVMGGMTYQFRPAVSASKFSLGGNPSGDSMLIGSFTAERKFLRRRFLWFHPLQRFSNE